MSKAAPPKAAVAPPVAAKKEEGAPVETLAPIIKKNGIGRFLFANGSVYDGEWQLFDEMKMRHGFGKYRIGAEKYDGEWIKDIISGKGKYEFASKSIYEGDWKNGRFQGRGTYTWPSGASYIGDWYDGKMHGQGLFITHYGDRYQGRFHNDRFLNQSGQWVVPQVIPPDEVVAAFKVISSMEPKPMPVMAPVPPADMIKPPVVAAAAVVDQPHTEQKV